MDSNVTVLLLSICGGPLLNPQLFQSAGKQGSTGMVLEEAMKERQQDQPLLCKVHACTRTEVVVWGSKMEGKNDLSCRVGEDKSTRKLATFSGFWCSLPTAEGEKKAKRKEGS